MDDLYVITYEDNTVRIYDRATFDDVEKRTLVFQYRPKTLSYHPLTFISLLRRFRWKILQYIFWHYPKCQEPLRKYFYKALHDTGTKIKEVRDEIGLHNQ